MFLLYLNILVITNFLSAQECPPADTLFINQSQNLWNIPTENNWNNIEVMTWNIENFPINNNTISYVYEIITDLLPDIIGFQEINDLSAYSTLENSLPAYEFITSGTGLALAIRRDVIEINNWTTLFSGYGYEFAWRYPLKVELSWTCGNSSITFEIINIHLKSGGSNSDFERRLESCQLLSDYINESANQNIIILGDFNDEITDQQNNNSLWPLISNNSINFTTASIANIDEYATYPSWPSFIDHIAVTNGIYDQATNETIKTIRVDDYTGYSFYHNNISDHRPVVWSFSTDNVDLGSGLVINEIMQNPTFVSDILGEWIEITNISDTTINLNGLMISDNDGESHIINSLLIIESGEYIVLGSNSDYNSNGFISVDYEYNNFTLSNLWDEIILSHPSGLIIDQIAYDNGLTFPDENGRSMSLISPSLDNSSGENWSASQNELDSGDYGTPGFENFSDAECDPNGDINNDTILNILDIILLSNYILYTEGIDFSDFQICVSDINQDLIINILDIIQLIYNILN